MARMWNMKTVQQVMPTVVGLLGSVTKNLDKWLELFHYFKKLHLFTRKLKARILRKVLDF